MNFKTNLFCYLMLTSILILSFARPVNVEAASFNCAGVAGNINRGCEAAQEDCDPFDFENVNDYLSISPNRAIYKLCDCIPETFDTIVAGDFLDIQMKILVDQGNGKLYGDNGIYWAEEIPSAGISLGLFDSQAAACETDSPYGSYFTGNYKYLKADGMEGTPFTGQDDGCESLADFNRVVEIRPISGQALREHGYCITHGDEFEGNCTWVIDIPAMRVDPTRILGGEKVWVRICIMMEGSGLGSDMVCCADIYIGQLCGDGYVSTSVFYEQYYLAQNSDVAKAVHVGLFGTGWEHFLKYGKQEGRAYEEPAGYNGFSELYYLANNPDVARAVETGLFGTGWEHYKAFGMNEGRSYAKPGNYENVEYGGMLP
jgi:hypothetical protein